MTNEQAVEKIAKEKPGEGWTVIYDSTFNFPYRLCPFNNFAKYVGKSWEEAFQNAGIDLKYE